MKFIWKFFRALNSAQTPFQITLALALGMVMGLTPMAGIQTVLIILLAFVLNIHLGLFFLASAFFAGVGYLFDPWFEQLGFMLLASSGLEAFWIQLYNNAFFRLTHFNNTIVLGSSLVAILLALPAIWLLNRVIGLYRTRIEAFLQAHPAFGKFGILAVSDKPLPLFRWWGVGAFAVFAALLVGAAMLFANPLLKYAAETSLSTLLQRSVTLESATVHFSDLSIELAGLDVASDHAGKNLVSIETVVLDPDPLALIKGSVHIAQLDVRGIALDTAALKTAKAKAPAEGEAEEGAGFAFPSLSLPSARSVLEKADLHSVKVYNGAKQKSEALKAKWEKIAKEDLSPEAYAQLQADFEALRKKAKSKDPMQMLSLAKEVEAFTKKVKTRQKRLQSIEKEFRADRAELSALVDEVKAAPQADFARLRSVYDLEESALGNVAGAFFGEEVKAYTQKALSLYAKVSPYLKSDDAPPAVVPPRGEGRWMTFAATEPNFWIKAARFDGLINTQRFVGEAHQLSDAQRLVGSPATLHFKSDGKVIQGLRVDAEFNRLAEVAKDTARISAQRLSLDDTALGMLQLAHADLAFDTQMLLSGLLKLEGKGDVRFTQASLSAPDVDAGMKKALESTLAQINAFSLKTTLGGTVNSPEIGVTSDLDKKLSRAVGNTLRTEAAAQETRLKALLAEKTSGQLPALNETIGGMPDIGGLVSGRNDALDGLKKEAARMAGGGALKGVLPF